MDQSIIGVLEQQRRDALVAWYLGQLVPKGERLTRVLNENDLYEYLLIDNQVSAHVDTSRVAQGIASVQQHIHAIYNGMEPGYGSFDSDAMASWRESMSQYSLWAGYQMLEDYPENYLDPTLRLDKTSMFKAFEGELAQARLSRDSVQQALGNYLQAFESVSNLQVVGCYVDDVKFINADYYFLGRQNIEPFGYYWRSSRLYKNADDQQGQMASWTEWKTVESIMGANVKHACPVVMDGRLYVVWAQSGKALVDAEGKKSGEFEYAIKVSWRRLDDTWSPPVELYKDKAPDELSANDIDSQYALTKGYRLTVSADHRNRSRSRLLIGFRSVGFKTDLSVHLAFDEFLNPLTATTDEGVATLLALVAGVDVRRAGFCVDQLDPDPKTKNHWKIVSVVWDKAEPPTTMGSEEFGINQHLELQAQWRAGKVELRGYCNKPVLQNKLTYFEFVGAAQGFDLDVSYSVKGLLEGLTLRVEAIRRVANVRLVPFDIYYLEEKIASFSHEDLYSLGHTLDGERLMAVKTIDKDADQFDTPTFQTAFSVVWIGGVEPLRLWVKVYKDVPLVMDADFYHYRNATLYSEAVTLNGAAQSLTAHAWPASEPATRTYQWGGDAGQQGRTKFGLNGFTVTREAITGPAPVVSVTTEGAQYLDLTTPALGVGNVLVRLNTLFAKALTRRASVSVESALSWETQHTEEPLLTGQVAPVYVDLAGANGLYFWEIFFHVPHLVATRLQQEFDYAGAQRWLEYLFNPQMRVAPLYPPPAETDWLPYWTCRPLGLADNPAIELEGLTNPDAIARGAPSHYRKAIFMAYLNNLIAWGDMLYRQVTRDTLNEAKLLYVRALSLLGPLSKGRSMSLWAPVSLADAAAEATETFESLEASMGRAVADLIPLPGTARPWLRLLDKEVFRLPVNTQLLDFWDRLDLRLHNLRHNLTLDGKPLQLALYEAPANPMDLLRAQLNGSSVSARRLGSLAIIPPYRFRAMLPRAVSATDTLVRFAQQVLGYMEAKDRAEQDELQQGHVLDDLATFAEQLKTYAIEEASKGIEVLQASRRVIEARKRYYDQQITEDVSALERSAQSQRQAAMISMTTAHSLNAAGHLANLAPNLFGGATGGMQLGSVMFASAEGLDAAASTLTEQAQQALISDSQLRRREEWQRQAAQADLELAVTDLQIDAQRVALAAAKANLAQASKAREHAQTLYAFIKNRTAGVGLYRWLLSQMSTLYFQAYDAVLSLCLSTEASWRYEVGDRDTRFISATAWVDNRFGLTAGETLKLGLLQMESAFLSRHERRLEISKTVSLKALLAQATPASSLAPAAWEDVLESLRTTGEIEFQLKSSTFDKDYPGHYLRQLTRVSVSLPVVLAPYQDIRATLSQQSSSYLLEPQIDNVKHLYKQAGDLPENEQGEDTRQDQLVFNPRANQQIGLSTGVDDDGLFMLDFGDERYLPFEGTGAISRWTLSFPHHESDEQQAMFDTLTDVILHIRYLAVDGGKAFTAEVEKLVAAVEDGQTRRQPTSLT
ncbi:MULTISPECIES: neuraminidase-like domain-containing protein [unclassified Pseudomonas]|uniref:Tc toxin subunit A-related protein n=1 Tax=unclassified Pseudomonas TaxID=196821 RepID=UPI000D38C544|nr:MULTISPECIES: neuraminidase-like domain-containing protein [unclassified Pseudomonas]RAU45799.1 hypothetical protein DBP26_012530 [Pseudomonas sp. RIT 409]RAU56102.1 hypothetical protein DBY65_002965 [Pseudomonas sp. RIT 412]